MGFCVNRNGHSGLACVVRPASFHRSSQVVQQCDASCREVKSTLLGTRESRKIKGLEIYQAMAISRMKARVDKPASMELGLAEWFGRPIWSLTHEQRAKLSEAAGKSFRDANMPCPFRLADDPEAKCNKKGGACSFLAHEARTVSGADFCTPILSNGLETFCPSRFLHGNMVFKLIGDHLFGVADAAHRYLVKEVDFLQGVERMGQVPIEVETKADNEEGVGRIDRVLLQIDTDGKILDWCAIEMQAVYFSGPGMQPYFDRLGESEILPNPVGRRRPDYRSSGPKRLMPQLQVKVPSLRRWGKKMVVVVDRRFFNTLGKMKRANHPSNADIVTVCCFKCGVVVYASVSIPSDFTESK